MLRFTACVMALVLPIGVSAADYPTRNARLIIPFAPGSANDVLARILAQHLSECWGKPFIVENRPGAAGVGTTPQ